MAMTVPFAVHATILQWNGNLERQIDCFYLSLTDRKQLFQLFDKALFHKTHFIERP